VDFFKGYILTADKKAAEKFKNRNDFKTYEQVKDLSEFAGILNQETILIDIDDYDQSELLMKIVEDLDVRCRVYETTRGKHFLFKNTVQDTCKTHTKLACGLTADIKVGVKNSYEVLKYNGKEREIIYDIYDDEEYEEVPKWLLPIKSSSEFYKMSGGDGRNQAFFNYILTLSSNGFTKDETKECIRIINDYVVCEPLSKSELEVVLRDDAFKTPTFFESKTFLFDKFAHYLINMHNVIKINGRLHIYRDGIYIDGASIIEAEMIKHIPNLNKQKRSEVLSYMDLLVEKNSEVCGANYIAFKNGVYDLDNDELLPFNPNLIITNKINYNYNANAYFEKTDKTLNKLACQDEAIRNLLEEVIGYCFYKRNELRKCFVLVGSKSNGKSTYLDIVKTLLGEENCSSLDISEFGNRFSPASLFGKLANIGDDIGDTFVDGGTAAIFKKVVSGDRIRGEFKGQNEFFFNPFCKVLLSANDIPRIGKAKGSDAIIDRLIIVPFEATFSPDDEDYDPYIKYKLKTDESMEYLITLGIKGLKRVLKNNKFTINEKIKRELENYEQTNNPILLFFKDTPEEEVENEPTKDVFRKYAEFCIVNNFTPMSNIEFSKQVNKYYGFEVVVKSVKGKSHRVFIRR